MCFEARNGRSASNIPSHLERVHLIRHYAEKPPLRPIRAVEAAVLDGLGNMFGLKIHGAFEISDGAGDFEDAVRENVLQNQYDLAGNGRVFLLNEARNASFFLLGELHGENEIPALLRDLWPQTSHDGYRYIAA